MVISIIANDAHRQVHVEYSWRTVDLRGFARTQRNPYHLSRDLRRRISRRNPMFNLQNTEVAKLVLNVTMKTTTCAEAHWLAIITPTRVWQLCDCYYRNRKVEIPKASSLAKSKVQVPVFSIFIGA